MGLVRGKSLVRKDAFIPAHATGPGRYLETVMNQLVLIRKQANTAEKREAYKLALLKQQVRTHKAEIVT